MMKILLALDSSPRFVDEAVRLAREKQAHLTGLFIMDATWNEYIGHDWLSGSNARAGFLGYIEDEEKLEAQRAIMNFEQAAADVPHSNRVAAGRVADEICRELSQGYDLLLMPYPFSRGLEVVRDPLPKILKGSSCPVHLMR